MFKKILFIIVLIIGIMFVTAGLYYYHDFFYKSLKKPVPTPTPNPNPSTSHTYVPNPNYKPPVPFFTNDPALKNMTDDYVLPDFARFESLAVTEPLIKSLPKDGSIRLGFFHFVAGIRKWDKVYYITKGNIETKNKKADFDIWIKTDYVSMFDGTNMCAVITKAREKGDLGQDTSLSEKEILWKYMMLLKYRSCFGI
jgi:hypothetical protein